MHKSGRDTATAPHSEKGSHWGEPYRSQTSLPKNMDETSPFECNALLVA
jgi:hypothetical protein